MLHAIPRLSEGWCHSSLARASFSSVGLQIEKLKALLSSWAIAKGFGADHTLAQHPSAAFAEGHEGVDEVVHPAFGFAAGWIGVLAAVALAQVTAAGVGDFFGVNGNQFIGN